MAIKCQYKKLCMRSLEVNYNKNGFRETRINQNVESFQPSLQQLNKILYLLWTSESFEQRHERRSPNLSGRPNS